MPIRSGAANSVERRPGSRRLAMACLARCQRGPPVEIGWPAAQTEIGEHEEIVGLDDYLLLPVCLGAHIDADLDPLLLDRQDVFAMLVQLVDFAFAFDVGALA